MPVYDDFQKKGPTYDEIKEREREEELKRERGTLDYDHSQNSQNGGGEDHAAKASAKSEGLSSDDLKSAEEAGGAQAPTQAEEKESSLGGSEDQLGSGYRKEKRRNGRLSGSGPSKSFWKKRGMLIGIGGGGFGLIAIIFIMLFFLSSLKTVHFATVLRSAGFARFNLYMRKEFSRTIFDAAVLTDDSTGSFKLKDRSLLDRLRGVNPEKQLGQLGREETLKFNFEGESKWGGLKRVNDFKGVEVNGEKVNLDDIAGKFGYKSYNDIPKTDFRAKLGVKAEFTNTVRDGLAERLALEGRSFRSGVYDGLRQATGIRMWKWLNEAREWAGKSPPEARAKEVDQSVENIDEGKVGKESALDSVNEDAKAQEEARIKAAKEGTPPPEVRSKLAETVKGVSDLSDVVLISTVACIIHDLHGSFDKADKEREQRVARFGHDTLSAADQIKKGHVVAEAVGAENSRWDGAEQAAFYKQAQGQTLGTADQNQLASVPPVKAPWSPFASIIDIADKAIFNAAPGSAIISHIPVLGDLQKKGQDLGCNVVLNEYVQYGIAGAEIVVDVVTLGTKEGVAEAIKGALTAGLKLAGTVGIGELVGQLIESAVSSYAGTDYSGTATSTDLYNQSTVAVDYLQQTGARQISYGRPVDNAESAASQAVAMDSLRNEYNHSSFSDRYFSIANPFSLIGHVAASIPASKAQFSLLLNRGIMGFVSSSLNLFQKTFSMFSNIFMPHSYAFAAVTNSSANHNYYEVDQWGWSNQELSRIESDEAFTPQSLAVFVEPRYEELNSKYSKCYSYELQSERPDECTKDFLGSDEALKWRAYMAESYAADKLGQDLLDPSTQ